MGTNPYYVCQASAGAYTEEGDVNDNFLWSIEVHGGTSTTLFQSPISMYDEKIGEEVKNYSIYPNPVKDRFQLLSVNIMKDTKVIIYNLSGSAILSREIQNSNEQTFDLSAYPTGIYTMIIVAPEGKKELKIIKQ